MTDDTLKRESEALVKQLLMMVDFTDDRAQRPSAMTDAVIAFARAKQDRIEQLEAERDRLRIELREKNGYY